MISRPGRSTFLDPGVRAAGGCAPAPAVPRRGRAAGATSLPAPSGRTRVHKPPVALPVIGARLARGLLHQLREADPAHHERPQLNVATQDARWFLLCTVDGVTATTADAGVWCSANVTAPRWRNCNPSLRQHPGWPANTTTRGVYQRRCRCCPARKGGSRCCSTNRRPMSEARGDQWPTGPGPPTGEVACSSTYSRHPVTRRGQVARGMSHFGEHAAGWWRCPDRRLPDRKPPPGMVAGRVGAVAAHGAAILIKLAVDAAGRTTGHRRQRRHAQCAQLPLGARDVQHGRGYAAVPGHQVAVTAVCGAADGTVAAGARCALSHRRAAGMALSAPPSRV